MSQLYTSKRWARIAFAAVAVLAGASTMAPAQAQSFTQAQRVAPGSGTNTGGSTALELATDASGNSYVTGSFNGTVQLGGSTLTSAGADDIFVAKYDVAGVLLWATRAGGLGYDGSVGIALDAAGNAYLTGNYGGSSATFGTTTLVNGGGQDIVVAKLSPAGTWLWANRVTGTADDFGQSIAVDANSNVYVAAFFNSTSVSFGTTVLANSAGVNGFVARYDANGNLVWASQAGGNSTAYGNAVAVDASGSPYLFGDFSGNVTLGSTTLASVGGQDIFVAKLSTAGAYQWAVRAGGSGDDQAPAGTAIVADANGVYLTGRFGSGTAGFGGTTLFNAGGGYDTFIAKLTTSGAFAWAVQAGGNAEDRGEAIMLDGKGNLLTTGGFSGSATFGSSVLTSAGGLDIYVGKLNTNGTGLSAVRAGGSLDDTGFGVGTDNTGNTYSTGYYNSASAAFGPFTLTNPGSSGYNTSFLARQLADLTVSTPGQTSGGIYNNVTVTGPNGSTTLSSTLVANGVLTVQNGGTLNTNCQPVIGAGSFAVAAGGTLGICNAAGIAASGATGAVQVTGTRSFATDASYVYNGTVAQATGAGLPAQVRNLSTTNAQAVTLTAPVSVAQVLTVGGAGNLVLGGNALTLLSNSTGTALAVNSSTGIVSGNTATVQRYISSANTGLGYRHYSAPVSNTTVADLASAGFSPEISQGSAYNTSATPGTTTPFPTVFGYDQSRVTLANSYAPFDRGFVVPASTGTALAVGQGYAVNIAGTQLVDFVGTLNNGPQTLPLSRVAGNADAGWQLLGNPYPAPLDYALIAAGDRPNLDAAMYVYSSSAQYTGTYRSYVNGVGPSSIIPLGQGFFTRVSTGQTSGSITFRNAQRLTAPNATAFQRTTTDTRPLVQLELRGTTGPADALYAYAQAGATPAYDPTYDAVKLPNPSGLNLSSTATSSERLAIDGRPVFDATTVLPLAVGVPAAGSYTFSAVALNNLPAGLDAYLNDAQTGQAVRLSTQPSYTFSVTTAQAAALLVGRFTLTFAARTALATAPALTAAQVQLYPNPAHARFTVLMPGVTGATAVRAELVNALGQVVRRQAAALPASGSTLTVETAELAAGVYTLRLLAGPTTVAKRVVLQ